MHATYRTLIAYRSAGENSPVLAYRYAIRRAENLFYYVIKPLADQNCKQFAYKKAKEKKNAKKQNTLLLASI